MLVPQKAEIVLLRLGLLGVIPFNKEKQQPYNTAGNRQEDDRGLPEKTARTGQIEKRRTQAPDSKQRIDKIDALGTILSRCSGNDSRVIHGAALAKTDQQEAEQEQGRGPGYREQKIPQKQSGGEQEHSAPHTPAAGQESTNQCGCQIAHAQKCQQQSGKIVRKIVMLFQKRQDDACAGNTQPVKQHCKIGIAHTLGILIHKEIPLFLFD